MTRHTPGDTIDYTLATYLIDGLNINCKMVSGTSLARIPADEGSGFRAVIEMQGMVAKIECMSRQGWLDAAEGAVRQVVWVLSRIEDYSVEPYGGSRIEAN